MPHPNAGMPHPHGAGMYGAPPPMPQPGGGYPSSGHVSFGVRIMIANIYLIFGFVIGVDKVIWPLLRDSSAEGTFFGKGLTLETSALGSLYGGQITIKAICNVSLIVRQINSFGITVQHLSTARCYLEVRNKFLITKKSFLPTQIKNNSR